MTFTAPGYSLPLIQRLLFPGTTGSGLPAWTAGLKITMTVCPPQPAAIPAYGSAERILGGRLRAAAAGGGADMPSAATASRSRNTTVPRLKYFMEILTPYRGRRSGHIATARRPPVHLASADY